MKATKRFFIIISLVMVSAASAFGQEEFFNELGEINSNLPTSGPKEDLQPIEFMNPRADDIFWQKVVYRVIDLREKVNFPLYYPEEASDGRQSLFTLIFRLMQDGKIYGYKYDEAREIFSEETKLDFRKEVLDKFDIIYTADIDPITNDTIFIIDESDIPNREIMKFYLKEVWYFDKHSSVFNVKTMAICPILFREDYQRGMEKHAFGWIPFDMLRPHLAQTEVLLSDKNNGMRLSFDDLFIKRRYGSYIYKASNVQNRLLLQYLTSAEDVQKEQAMIKTEMLNFEEDLWEY